MEALNATGDLLGSFLPLGLLSRLHGDHGHRPAAVEFPAAVIFVDVSRYTALVEQLARRGHAGLESIPALLGRSYARCVEQVYDLGGEVCYLAGDTLVAYWPGDDDGLQGAVKAATECADNICKDRTAWSEQAIGEIAPALHVGVGAGRLWAAALGGQPTWNLVAGGEAVAQAARAHAAAERWKYELSDEAKSWLGRFPPAAGRTSAPARSGGCPDEDWLTDFLAPQLASLVRDTGGASGPRTPHAPCQGPAVRARLDALAEIRPVSVLFARFAGLDLRDPEALGSHQALCAALQEAVRSRGGPPGELLFDDKGLIFLAAFGAHGNFHRDDAVRAIDSAVAIDRLSRSMKLQGSVGVATGDVLFRVVGSERRRQLMMLGAPMNRAARLMTAVADGVVCDAPTERASRGAYGFRKSGTLQLEGLGDAAAVFAPLEPRTAAPASAALIGRKGELELLGRAFEEAHLGSRRLVVVLGEPGIGKTALVKAFTDRLISSSVEVSIARAEREDRSTSLLPWRRVLASILNMPADADAFALLHTVAGRLKGHSEILDRLPLLDGVLGVEIVQNDATRHLQGANRADATMRELADIIAALAPRPLVVVMEDSQWLDSASWRLVEWILASLTSLLVILCVRSEEVPEELKVLRRRAEAARINPAGMENDDLAKFCRILDLEELSDASICELVERTLPDAPAHPDLARRVARLAGGSPFFAEEIALTLRSQGLIAVRDGFWRPIRPLEDLRYFEGVERVIRERIDRLTRAEQSALKAAATIGRSFSSAALEGVLKDELGEEALAEALESLTSAHLVRQALGPGNYEFRHDHTRDVVYESIPGDVRRRLHETMARWLEANQSPSSSADTGILAQHFHAAGQKDKAVHHASIAATKALAIGAFREVGAFLDICFSHEPKEQPWTAQQRLDSVRWRRQLGEASHSLGSIRAQGVAIRRALTLAGEPVPESALKLALRFAKRGLQLFVQQWRRPAPIAVDDALRASWLTELARCLNQAAIVDFYELRFTRAFSHTIAAVAHAERIGQSREEAAAHAQLASGLGMLSHRRLALYFMRRADRTAIAMADPALQAQVCNLDVLWRIGHCDWDMVDRRLDHSQKLCVLAGDQLSWCNAQALRFWSLYYRGDWGMVEPAAQSLLSRAQNSGNLQQEIWALRGKALCVLNMGDAREAVDILKVVTSGAADPAEQVSSKGALALALARVGLHAESVEAAVETLDCLAAMRRPTVHSSLVGIAGVAEVLLRGREAGLSRDYDQWRGWERRAMNELRRFSRTFAVGRAQYALWKGVSHWLDGRTQRAFSSWQQAQAIAQRYALHKDAAIVAAEIRRRQ